MSANQFPPIKKIAISTGGGDAPGLNAVIRAAVLSALDHACPLCQGTGLMSPEQKKHWDAFARDHAVKHCQECDALYLTCGSVPAKGAADA